MDGMPVSMDGMSGSMDGMLVSMDGMSDSMDGILESMDGISVSMDGMPESMDGKPVLMDGIKPLWGCLFQVFSPALTVTVSLPGLVKLMKLLCGSPTVQTFNDQPIIEGEVNVIEIVVSV